jgi:hypothetical protein
MGVVDGPSVAPSEPTASRGPEPSGEPDVYPPVRCVGLAKACPELAATAGPEPSRPADRPAGTREDCAAAVLRLSSAVAGAMRDAMPGWGVTDSVDPGNPNTRWVFLRQAGDAVEDGYVAALGLAKGDQISHLNVTLSVGNRQDATAGCAGRQLKPEETCRVTARGDVLITSVQKLAVAPLPGSSVPPGHEMPTVYTVTDIRPDGTRVVVSGCSPLTTGQLEALAQAPGLTLFP